MNIPVVNAGVSIRNREQTKRICELEGWKYSPNNNSVWQKQTHHMYGGGWNRVNIPNSSFTLDQVVEMNKEDGVEWCYWTTSCDDPPRRVFGWCCLIEDEEELLVEAISPHNLTAAMDARIKILESKGKKEA